MLIPPLDHELDVLARHHRTIAQDYYPIALLYLLCPDTAMVAACFGLAQEL